RPVFLEEGRFQPVGQLTRTTKLGQLRQALSFHGRRPRIRLASRPVSVTPVSHRLALDIPRPTPLPLTIPHPPFVFPSTPHPVLQYRLAVRDFSGSVPSNPDRNP
ncbi:hypothetical protein GWI33_012089, partial [Rhynchophorus ferrugineus]